MQQFTDKRDRCDQGNFGKVLHAVTASFAFFLFGNRLGFFRQRLCGEHAGNDRPDDLVDDRCDDAGQDGHGIRERGLCERAGKAGVLQTNLKRQRVRTSFR